VVWFAGKLDVRKILGRTKLRIFYFLFIFIIIFIHACIALEVEYNLCYAMANMRGDGTGEAKRHM
jgi:hypothetical protein